MKLSDIQAGKQYIVCSNSACGTFVIGDVVRKYADGCLGNSMVDGLGGWLEKGQWENIDCEVEPIE
jgi:hypothetical protein